MKQVGMYLTCLFLLMGCGTPAVPVPTATVEPTVAPTAESKVIKLVTGEFPPLTGEAMPEQGAATEIVRAVFAKMGRKVEIDFKPWERAKQETLTGKYFGTFPWSSNDEREQMFRFSDNILAVDVRFFTTADSTFEFTTLDQLAGHTLCSPKGWDTFGVEKLVEADKIKMEQPMDMESCLHMMDAGRVEISFNGDLFMWYTIKNLFGDTKKFKASQTVLQTSENKLMISKEYPDGEKILLEFNQALKELKQEGKIEAIMQKYTQ